MPELAEVEYYRKQWSPGIGAAVLRVHVRPEARVFRGESAASIAHGLTGARFRDSSAHGKNLLFCFSRGFWLGGHLGMTGELLCLPPDHVPGRHDHLVLFQRKQALVFRDPRMFGRIRIHQGSAPPDWWQELPPQILSDGFSVRRLGEILRRRRKSPLKPLLLDQSSFPGIGNWMADEVLWRLKVPPAIAAGDLTANQAARLHRILKQLSRDALAIIGTTWADPPKSWLFLHRWKAGGSCPRCRTGLQREDLRGRTTCWCPKCQETAG